MNEGCMTGFSVFLKVYFKKSALEFTEIELSGQELNISREIKFFNFVMLLALQNVATFRAKGL